MTDVAVTQSAIETLRAAVAGPVLTPDQDGYAAEVTGFEMVVEHAPAIAVGATDAGDVVATVRAAAATGIPITVVGLGHAAIPAVTNGILLNTSRITEVALDPIERTARVGAGASWHDVMAAATPVGLAPLCGSAPGVGVAGYLLGGGLGPIGRTVGFSSDYVRSFDIVCADGELRTVSAERDPDLFWALRGGKGNFGAVTALEIALFPVSRLYGGSIYFPGERMSEVLRAWTAWHPTTPETMISSFAALRPPSQPEIPEPLRGVFSVALRIAYTGTAEDGKRMIAPLRAAAPAVLDTVADMPYTAAASIHDEPIEPLPYYERSIMLRGFPAEAQDKLVELVGPESDATMWITELRALGGAWDREPAVPNAVATRGLPYVLLGVEVGPLSEEQRLKESIAALLDGMAPWQGDRRLVNNLAPEEATDAVAIYGPERYERLAGVKKAYDPTNMFRLNHNVVPAV